MANKFYHELKEKYNYETIGFEVRIDDDWKYVVVDKDDKIIFRTSTTRNLRRILHALKLLYEVKLAEPYSM